MAPVDKDKCERQDDQVVQENQTDVLEESAHLIENEDEMEILVKEKEEMEKVIEELKTENSALKTAAASARADFFNFKNRVERDKERYIRLANEDLILQLLPVLDNFDRALNQSGDFAEDDIRKGVLMIRRQFFGVLESAGVSEIPTVGESFSPLCHEAVGIEAVDDPQKDGVIVTELQMGYKIGDKVVRASRVKVGKYVGKKDSDASINSDKDKEKDA